MWRVVHIPFGVLITIVTYSINPKPSTLKINVGDPYRAGEFKGPRTELDVKARLVGKSE